MTYDFFFVFIFVFLVLRAAIAEYHELHGLTNRNYWLTVLEVRSLGSGCRSARPCSLCRL